MANTSAIIWQRAAHTTCQLSSAEGQTKWEADGETAWDKRKWNTPQIDNWPVQGVILHAEVVPWKVARWIPQVVVLVPQNSLAATHVKPIAKIKTRINQQQQKWLKSLLLCLCGIFWVIIHSLVSFSFLFCTGALGLVPFQMINTHRLSVCCRTHINPQQ